MYKLLHLHQDTKFLYDTQRFSPTFFDNEIVYFGVENEQLNTQLQKIGMPFRICATTQESFFQEVVPLLKDYDAIVLNSYAGFLKKIIDHLPNNTKIFLRFFGYELYSLVRGNYLSKTTLDTVYPIKLKHNTYSKYFKKKLKRLFKREWQVDYEKQKQVYQKFTRILLFHEWEYRELSKYFYLPPFIPIPWIQTTDYQPHEKNNQLLIGNSKNLWNNHLDIIKKINAYSAPDTNQYIVFFNYGNENKYTQAIRELAGSSVKNYLLIEDFLSIEKFREIYKTTAALVINSYRQHALGNIFTGLFFGVKVYLNPKSSTYPWLKQLGFLVFDINQLITDIKNNQISLNLEEQRYNIDLYYHLKEQYTLADFAQEIIRVIEEN
jgi:hypothetical protein